MAREWALNRNIIHDYRKGIIHVYNVYELIKYQIKMNKYNVKLHVHLYPFLLTNIDFQILELKKSTEYPHDF